jgi:hypothetical protein
MDRHYRLGRPHSPLGRTTGVVHHGQRNRSPAVERTSVGTHIGMPPCRRNGAAICGGSSDFFAYPMKCRKLTNQLSTAWMERAGWRDGARGCGGTIAGA